ncbi:peptidylprolyl isomerase [Kordia sp.]|uniref:peptidylprolyl isomerase n=1 Tax=Kordia sp. TaxID=1965332 RepID=UPI0025B91A5E|nr:peptidylprolyl isomerase [Kordia sp.]MCH2196881.1 peptidylprolyl isomerase [Kordia sp.]
MAILAKIRQRTLVLILIIGLALFAFVISDVFNNNGGGEKRLTEIGTINGEAIPSQQFQSQVERIRTIYGGRQSTMQIVNSLWDQEVNNVLVTQQLDELGITIEKDELWSLLVSSPNITSSQQFQDESGTFVEAKLKEYIDNLEATKNLTPENMDAYLNWLQTEKYTITEAKKALYNNLVKAGSIVTVKEGELAYRAENDKVTFKYVQVPYTSIADSLVEIRNSDVQNYIDKHKSTFKVDESRDIQYVYFPETPSKSDEELAKKEVADLKTAFAAAEDGSAYANENTETNEPETFTYKSQLPKDVADDMIAMNVGDVYGPYKVGNKYKISRLIETAQLPDSTKTRHILINYKGSQRALPEVTRTKEDAKKLADSVFAVVKRNKSKFADLAKDLSSDKVSAEKGGDLDWFNTISGRNLTPSYRDFVFEKEVGDIDVVESPFGFHIIEIEDQKNDQKVVKFATINKEVEVTEETLTNLFTVASTFESDVNKAKSNFVDIAKEKNYEVKPVNKIKVLNPTISGISTDQREVVRWAFKDDTNVGDIYRANVGGGFLVVQLTAKNPAGLSSIPEASSRVLPILRSQKKAEKIKADYASSKTLTELASAAGRSEQQATSLSMMSPIIPGAGEEPKVVGAAFALNEGETSKLIAGKSGVYIIQVVKKEAAPAKDTYLTETNTLRNQRAAKATSSVFDALKSSAEIEDNRGYFY